jgi:hypothetical protein
MLVVHWYIRWYEIRASAQLGREKLFSAEFIGCTNNDKYTGNAGLMALHRHNVCMGPLCYALMTGVQPASGLNHRDGEAGPYHDA